MKQHFFHEEMAAGGMILEDQLFRGIVRPCFIEIPYHQPQKLRLSMGREEKSLCRPIVAEGDHISRYDMVGVRHTGTLEDMHVIRTDVSGTVTNIWNELIGFKKYETFIELYLDEMEDSGAVWNYHLQNDEEKRQCLTYSGIPGINHLLYQMNIPRRCRYIVLNVVEDDPSQGYNTYMLLTRPGSVLYGLLNLLAIVRADFAWIVVSERQTTAATSLTAAAHRYFKSDILDKFTMITVSDSYPLSDDTLEKVYLSERLSGDTWVIAHMDQVVGTYNMIYEGKPWTRKNIMIGGCLPVNGIYQCSVGTKLTDIPELTEYLSGTWMRASGILIDGGLMSGHTVDPEKAVVNSGSEQFLLLSRIAEYERQCRECHLCEKVCPQLLDPRESNNIKNREECTQCGLCSYVCPSRRRLTEYMHRGRPDSTKRDDHYIELPQGLEGLQPAVVTGYSAPYIRKANVPFACILSSFKVQ